jgi:breast cancer 2 susceptibility protein
MNPVPSAYPSFQRVSAHSAGPPKSAFVSAAALPITPSTSQFQSQSQPRSPSPEIPPERDYSAWFEPLPAPIPQTAMFTSSASLFAPASALPDTAALALFAPASAVLASTTIPAGQGSGLEMGANQPPLLGFMKASHKSFMAPSAAALEQAQKKMRVWHEDDLDGDPELDPHSDVNPDAATPAQQSKLPRWDTAADNSSFFPDTPTPAGPSTNFGTRRGFERPSASMAAVTNNSLPTFSESASLGFVSKPKSKSFKPLSINTKIQGKPMNANSAGFTSSPLNPSRILGFAPASAGTQQQHPLAGTPFTSAAMTPIRSASGSVAAPAGFATPMRSLKGGGSAVRSTPARFVTPFKAGMRPGEAGWVGIASQAKEKEKEKEVLRVDSNGHDSVRKTQKRGKERWKAFDLRTFTTRFFFSAFVLAYVSCTYWFVRYTAEQADARVLRPCSSML